MEKQFENNNIIIKQVGYTYIFKANVVKTREETIEIRNDIMQQLKAGCVVLPGHIELISVEPHLEMLVD